MNDRALPATITANPVLLVPFEHLERMAAAIAKSGLFGMKTADQALALMLIAQAEGQHPATITQDYDIIQGRGSRKTNSVLARYQQAGGSVEWHALTDKLADATFTPPPRAGKPLRLQWTIEMAKTAKLVGKDNWTGYARAMLRARCIAEGVRATYPAAIGGMLVSEEAQDLPPIDVTAQGSHTTEPPKQEPPAKPAYTEEAFAKNEPKWRDLIAEKKKTADDIITTIQSKNTLTAEQIAAIKALGVDSAALATPEAIDAMFDKAKEKAIADADIAKHLGVETLDAATLTVGQIEKAMAFIANPVGESQ